MEIDVRGGGNGRNDDDTFIRRASRRAAFTWDEAESAKDQERGSLVKPVLFVETVMKALVRKKAANEKSCKQLQCQLDVKLVCETKRGTYGTGQDTDFEK